MFSDAMQEQTRGCSYYMVSNPGRSRGTPGVQNWGTWSKQPMCYVLYPICTVVLHAGERSGEQTDVKWTNLTVSESV